MVTLTKPESKIDKKLASLFMAVIVITNYENIIVIIKIYPKIVIFERNLLYHFDVIDVVIFKSF